MTGNYLADGLRRVEVQELPLPIQKGVMIHQKIDAFTDAHPLVLRAKRRLYPYHGKYAGVLLDVWYDHLLSTYWDEMHYEPIGVFERETYKFLGDQLPYLQGKPSVMLQRILTHRWLHSYYTLEGIEKVFFRLREKVSKPALLKGAVERLDRDAITRNEFPIFYLELRKYVKDLIAEVNPQNSKRS
jgi:acyl carrier protein phosphodiesterase